MYWLGKFIELVKLNPHGMHCKNVQYTFWSPVNNCIYALYTFKDHILHISNNERKLVTCVYNWEEFRGPYHVSYSYSMCSELNNVGNFDYILLCIDGKLADQSYNYVRYDDGSYRFGTSDRVREIRQWPESE